MSPQQDSLGWMLHAQQHVFIDKVTVLEWPHHQGVQVPPLVHGLLDYIISTLFMNVVIHGGKQVRVRCTVDREKMMTLDVIDDGPGFHQRVFDDQSTSLYWRREDARALDGDLTVQQTSEGTDVRLVVSLKQSRRRRRP